MLTEDERVALVEALRRGAAARRNAAPTEAEIAAVLSWAEEARASAEPDPAWERVKYRQVADTMLDCILNGEVLVDIDEGGEPTFQRAD
jgi:hypothetical protein